MVRAEGQAFRMSKWWFSHLFFRKKKIVPLETHHPDFATIENTCPLSCPTRDRAKGPPGRKRPTRAVSATLPARVQEEENDSSKAVARRDSCHESLFSKNDGNFNQTTGCVDIDACDLQQPSAALHHDTVIASDQQTPEGSSECIQVL